MATSGQQLRPQTFIFEMNGLELAGDSMQHHRFLVGLMEGGDLDWRVIDAWLRDNVEES